MKSNHKWLKAAVAAVGAGALTLGGAAIAATAAPTPTGEATPQVAKSDKYELAASRTDSTVAELKRGEAEGYLGVSNQGFVYHVDPAIESSGAPKRSAEVSAGGAAIPGTPEGGSRPGAPVTVYLNFGGETLTGTHWNTDSGKASLPFGPTTYADRAAEVWAGVAEDFAPFNVNVTTTRPSDAKLIKSSMDDAEYGVHVIITDSYDEVLPKAAGTSGYAWIDAVGSDYLTGALVFTKGMLGADDIVKSIADTASHEAGHNFGLQHAGFASDEYYYPRAGVWGPIMGSPYDVPVSQWTDRQYPDATNTGADDLSVITNAAAKRYLFVGAKVNGAPYTGSVCVESGDGVKNPKPGDVWRVPNASNLCDGTGAQIELVFNYTDRAKYADDTVGNTPATAKVLDNAAGSFADAAVIERNDDVDVFKVTTDGGTLAAKVEVAALQPNLDAKLTVTNEAGEKIAEDNPESSAASTSIANGLGAEISVDVAKGTYYLAVEGTGAGGLGANATPTNANGYSKYGSLGNYRLSGTVPPSTDVPTVKPIAITSPADKTAVDADSDVAITGTANPGATITVTPGDVTATADAAGNWTATIKSATSGDTVVVATQTVDGTVQDQKATITLTTKVTNPEELAAPKIVYPANGDVLTDTTPTISGTGKAGASVAVTVTAAAGAGARAAAAAAANGTATVDADGNWEWTTAELAAGAYTASATQSADGKTSPASAAVNFTVQVKTTPTTTPTVDPTNPTTPTTKPTEIAVTGNSFDGASSALLGAGLLALGVTTALVITQRRKLAAER